MFRQRAQAMASKHPSTWLCWPRVMAGLRLVVAGVVVCGFAVEAGAGPDAGIPSFSVKQNPLSPKVLKIAQQLVNGQGKLNILYFGNSRVAGGWIAPPDTRGFCLAGCQPHTKARGLLTGTGYINPYWKPANGGALFSTVTTDGYPVHKLPEDVHLNTTCTQGVRLSTKQHITTSGVVPSGPISAKDALTFTVLYRKGPSEGTFVMTPLSGKTASTMKPLTASAKTMVAKATGVAHAAFVNISIPGVASGTVVRGLKITGSTGYSHIFELHARTSASTGFTVGRIAVGGHGYPNQMRTTKGKAPRCRRQDFVTHLESFDPDVVILQYASNQLAQELATNGNTGWVKAAKELLGRVRDARNKKPFLTILQLDHRRPTKNSGYVKNWAKKDILATQAVEKDCLVLNPDPYLPVDWPPEGTGTKSKYFRDTVHENPLGAKTVWGAMFKDLTAIVATMTPPKADMGVPDQGPPDILVPDLMQPDVMLPDQKKPDLALPDLKKPDLSLPDLKNPDQKQPDLPLPDMASDTAAPDTAMVDAAVPDAKKQDTPPGAEAGADLSPDAGGADPGGEDGCCAVGHRSDGWQLILLILAAALLRVRARRGATS